MPHTPTFTVLRITLRLLCCLRQILYGANNVRYHGTRKRASFPHKSKENSRGASNPRYRGNPEVANGLFLSRIGGLTASHMASASVTSFFCMAPLEFTAKQDFALGIDAVNLENRLRDVETNCRHRLHGSSSESWEP